MNARPFHHVHDQEKRMPTYAGRRCHLREPPPPESGEDFCELFAGPPPECPEPAEERAARLAAARDVLAELLHDAATDDLAREDALYALRLASGARRASVALRAPSSRVGEAA
jgi:hypothetical protein